MECSKLKIGVIGCGWLGLPLCERLIALGHTIMTTTTSKEKYESLSQKLSISLLKIEDHVIDQKILTNDIIIYTIPPQSKNEVEQFFKNLKSNQKIIFISSISVYGKSEGMITEESPFAPVTKNAISLVQSEHFLRSHFKNITIIRPGGLIGNDRHPINSLKGKTNLTNGEDLLHLVHLVDCLEAILSIIKNNIWAQDFNLVNDLRIPKENYYKNEAIRLGFLPPQYEKGQEVKNPMNISNEKSKKLLMINYKI